jgi:hypothetical protein
MSTTDTMPKQKAGASKTQTVLRRPFIVGTREVDKSTYDQTKALTASSQTLPSYEVDPTGFLSELYIIVEATSTASAAVVFGPDGPFSALDSVTLNDTNNKPIVGPLSGWDLYILAKFGGYTFCDDARSDPSFSSATSGSFAFTLRLPVEIVHRDAVGALPNKSASATYTLNMTLAAMAAGAFVSVPQNALPSVRVRVQQEGWMDPNTADIAGNPVAQSPPGGQTTQYWTKQTDTFAFGSLFTRLKGIDSHLRNLIFVIRDSTAASATAAASATGTSARNLGDSNWPDPFVLQYETSTPVNRIKTAWKRQMLEDYGYIAAVGTGPQEAANSLDKGVFVLAYNKDFGHKPGAESRFSYLPCSASTPINISGTQGANGTTPGAWTYLANKIVIPGNDIKQLTGGR